MNLNRINGLWPVPQNNLLHLIDTMSIDEAEKSGLITEQESEVLTDLFEQNLRIALEEKGHATSEDLQPVPHSKIVRQLRRRLKR